MEKSPSRMVQCGGVIEKQKREKEKDRIRQSTIKLNSIAERKKFEDGER